MSKRKAKSPEIQKTILPIGEDVPKTGIPAPQPPLSNAQKRQGTADERFQKDDGFGPKIGPKGLMHKIDASTQKDLKDLSDKVASGGKFKK